MDKVNLKSLILFIACTWTILWTSNFYGQGTKIALIGGIAFILINSIFLNVKFRITTLKMATLILLFGITYTIIMAYFSSIRFNSIVSYTLLPVSIFLSYYTIVELFSDKKSLTAKSLLYSLSLGFFVLGLANMSYSYFMGAFENSSRVVLNIWSGKKLSVTNQGVNFTLSVALALYMIFNVQSPWKKWFGLFLIISSLLSTFIMGNRTLLVIFMVLSLYALFFQNKIRKSKLVLYSILIVISGYIAFNFNLFRIKSILLETSFFARFQGSNFNELLSSGRYQLWITAIRGIVMFPLGGLKDIGAEGYAHNLWLDIGYKTGIIPLVIFGIITISLVYLVIDISKKKNKEAPLIQYFFIALMLNYFVEPIIEGYYSFFLVMFVLLGVLLSLKLKTDSFHLEE